MRTVAGFVLGGRDYSQMRTIFPGIHFASIGQQPYAIRHGHHESSHSIIAGQFSQFPEKAQNHQPLLETGAGTAPLKLTVQCMVSGRVLTCKINCSHGSLKPNQKHGNTNCWETGRAHDIGVSCKWLIICGVIIYHMIRNENYI